MLFNETILKKVISLRNLNLLIHGTNNDILNTITMDNKTAYNIDYKQSGDIYMINIKSTNKNNILELITDVGSSPNFYGVTIRKKIIILVNIQNLKSVSVLKLKSIVESSFDTACFILHTTNINKLDHTFRSRFLMFTLPFKEVHDDTISITYNRIIKLINIGLNVKTIEDIRELCYMYYMNHTTSIDLQRYIVDKLASSLILPYTVKLNTLRDIAEVNHLYGYSYRKPLYLEYIIYSLFKHLEYYTI